MKALVYLYDKALEWSRHQHAPKYLAAMSFIESSVFPVPPDVMLAPMVLAKPPKAFWYAFICTLFSVLGGLLGYILGYFLFGAFISEFIVAFGYQSAYKTALQWFAHWGLLAVIVAGFTPIPYKLFTISAGVLQFNIGLFFIASVIGRGCRFFLVSGLIRFGGVRLEAGIRKIIDRAGWVFVLLVFVGVLMLQLR